MNRHLLLAFAGAAIAVLAGCNHPETPEEAQARATSAVVNIPGMGQKACLNDREIGIYGNSSYELTGQIRAKLLTPAAQAAGVRVMGSSTETTNFGTQVLYYYAPDGNCLIWSESLTHQEYATRLGLDPLGISPFYTADKAEKPEEKK